MTVLFVDDISCDVCTSNLHKFVIMDVAIVLQLCQIGFLLENNGNFFDLRLLHDCSTFFYLARSHCRVLLSSCLRDGGSMIHCVPQPGQSNIFSSHVKVSGKLVVHSFLHSQLA